MRTLLIVSFVSSVLWSQSQAPPESPQTAKKGGTEAAQQKAKPAEAQQRPGEAGGRFPTNTGTLRRQGSRGIADKPEIGDVHYVAGDSWGGPDNSASHAGQNFLGDAERESQPRSEERRVGKE